MDAPAVAVTADGKAVALAWMDMRRKVGERDVFWRLLRAGAGEPEGPLSGDQKGVQGHVSLAFGPNGTLYAAWESNGRVFWRAGRDGEETLVSGDDEGASFPSLAAGAKAAVVAYECNRGGRSVVVCKRAASIR